MRKPDFNQKLIKLLESNPNFVDGAGSLHRANVRDRAWKLDPELISLLLTDQEIEAKFFTEIEGRWIFNYNIFVDYITDKNFFADSYTKFRNKIGLNIDGKYLRERGEVALVWPYKDCVLEGGQTREEEKRKEIFFNEILAPDEINRMFDPKVLTNWKRHTANSEQDVTDIQRDENGTIRENLIIKGNNLIALHTLKEQFREKVKLIYIDPPYNTKGESSTFGYNNSFNHSSWLTFIRNRLEIAKDLLRDDGLIIIAIDDEEQAYLAVLCDEIFGRLNHIGTVIVQSKPSGRTTDSYFATCHEYLHIYSKQVGLPAINFLELTDKQKSLYTEGTGKNLFKWRDFLRTGGLSTPKERPNSYYPIYFLPQGEQISLERVSDEQIEILPLDSNGNKRVWRKTPPSFLKHVNDNEIKIEQNRSGQWKVKIIDKIKEGTRPKSVWTDSKYDASSHGTKLLKNLFEGQKVFSYPKSINAVKDVIEILSERGSDDIILDFFAGSGTTAHAVLGLNKQDNGNRQFILMEQMDYIENVTVKRVEKVMKEQDIGDFIYCELMPYNEVFMKRIQSAQSSEDLLDIWRDMSKDSVLNWYVKPQKPMEAEEHFIAINDVEKQKQLLTALLDKNQLYVHLSEIEDEMFAVSEADKELNQAFYGEGLGDNV
ncbi:site-specific DNA-methyltransferase [Candidatus Poribacteria bacterium]|nr:site-specific DNA-methyltransferase [Candidatus Poribacteria bacterium]MYK22847.1 site-specific DNA-methyltransferase [Candidatus Poribacteria bacterium]